MKGGYRFSSRFKDAQEDYDRIVRLQNRRDELVSFALGDEPDAVKAEYESARVVFEENLDKLFLACKKYGIPRIFIGERELVGADEIKVKAPPFNSERYAIWELKDELSGGYHDGNGYAGGCANGDQAQTNNSHLFLPWNVFDKAFDVETREEINNAPFHKRMVVTWRKERKETYEAEKAAKKKAAEANA